MPAGSARAVLTLFFALGVVQSSPGQLPSGGISGSVSDPSDAVVRDAEVTARSVLNGSKRATETDSQGEFSFGLLPPGVYQLRVEAEGFQDPSKRVVVQTGATTRVDIQLTVDVLEQVVEALDALPELRYDWHGVDGVVSRFEIENLPLNGREFLQLAVLEPGVAAAPRAGFFSRQFDVSILGASPNDTRYTLDGSPVHNPLTGGTPQNASQEVVQEFQVQTVNFDLATGLTGAGAVNVVTRSGGNELHGSGFFFFRDHNLSAYPALRREPANPDPFFARRQWGFHVGGPIVKDRLFFFTNLEENNQDGVFTIQPRSPDFAGFGGIFPSPFDSTQVSARFDVRVSDKNMAFFRYSHFGSDGFAPPSGQGNLPSNWSSNSNWVDQSVGSLSSAFRPNLINELRFSYWYFSSRNLPPNRSNCPGECIGLGMPEISILGSDFVAGHFVLAPQGGDTRRYHLTDNVSWQKGRHSMRFGFEWQYERGGGFLEFVEPASMVLYSPEIVRAFNADPRVPPQARIALPESFRTLDDVLQLPLVGFSVGFGDATLPPRYSFNDARHDHLWRVYWQDSWRMQPRFTLNYGLSYFYHPDLANHTLSKPEFLEPILGTEGLRPTRRDRNNFGPMLGFAWNVSRDNRTVVRAGSGVYYELPLDSLRLRELSTIGPRGAGRFIVDGSIIPNPVPGVPGVPPFTPLNFTNGPTNFRGSHVLEILPDVKGLLESQLGDPANTDLSVRNIEIFKQGTGLVARDFVSPYSIHFNAGIQREVATHLVVAADYVYRRFVHQNMGDIDLNRWGSIAGPVISACQGLEVLDETAMCSSGPITALVSGGLATYQGLLVKLEKRWSGRYQFRASYALSNNRGFNGIVDNSDWFASYGPRDFDRRHVFTFSGMADLPWGLRLSGVSKILSGPPFRAQLFGVDLDGDGTINDLLPGTGWNELNRGLDRDSLQSRVDGFNSALAGGRTPGGQPIPALALPSDFEFGDSTVSQDIRLAKIFKFSDRHELSIFGEVFNLFNVANLDGYGVNVGQSDSFGQPNRRATQVFGSGGPRALQLGARVTF